MQELRRLAMTTPSYPAILFFYQGSRDDGAAFFGQFWPEARAVADPERQLYRAFGIERGGVRQLFGPEVWTSGLRAARKGNSLGMPVGDPLMMPGVFLVRGETILWSHAFRHAGDQPDFAHLPSVNSGTGETDDRQSAS
ncbi:MAG: AhpC/TSA family protein [Candidatus Binatia bacterium]